MNSNLLANKTICDATSDSKSNQMINSRYISNPPDDFDFNVKKDMRCVLDKPNERYVNETLKQPINSIPTTYQNNMRKANKNHFKSHVIGHKSKEEIQMKNIFQKPKNKAPLKEFESNYQGTDMPQTIYDEGRRFSESQTNTREVIHTEFLGNTLDKLNKKQLKSILCAQCGVRVVEVQGSYCDFCKLRYL